jgi:hypothetical protein
MADVHAAPRRSADIGNGALMALRDRLIKPGC